MGIVYKCAIISVLTVLVFVNMNHQQKNGLIRIISNRTFSSVGPEVFLFDDFGYLKIHSAENTVDFFMVTVLKQIGNLL